MQSYSLTRIRQCRIAGLKPPPRLTVDEWADERRYLDNKSSAEPGRWRTARTPYLRQIMRDMGPYERVQTVVFVKGAQLGGTECINNFLGFAIDLSPAPILFVSPTLEMAKRNSRQRVAPLIEASPALRSKVQNPRSRDSGNTLFMKEFPGGVLILTGANSAAGLRSMPAKYRLYDEVDAYEADVEEEGDPISLGEARGRTFVDGKRVEVSTPTKMGRSRIWADYEQARKFLFFLPCPHCGEYQPLVFKNLKWPKGEPLKAEYFCESCGAAIGEEHKGQMLTLGEWRPAEMVAMGTGEWKPTEGGKPGWHGYHLSSLYSPLGWQSWAEIADAWERSQGDPAQLKAFVNTVLGLPWRDRGDAPDWNRLYERREQYPPNWLPMKALFVTVGVDVQKDRLEASIWAWGEKKESWFIDHRVFLGDPTRNEVWAKVSDLLSEEWPHEGGSSVQASVIAIDSGYATNEVYNFVRRMGDGRLMAIKGQEYGSSIVGAPSPVEITTGGKKIKGGVRVWPVATSPIKFETYGFLRQDTPETADYPAGYVHLHRLAEAEYCKQFCAEEASTVTKSGQPRVAWQKHYDRNEALDCRVYARAAAYVVGLDRFNEQHFEQLRQSLGIREGVAQAVSAAQTPAQPVNRGRRVRSQGI